MSSPVLSSFFFYSSRVHLDLHSFPTRRSSDLSKSSLPASWEPSRPPRTTCWHWILLPLCTSETRVGDSCSDRKSTRLNSSHEWISYAVFCLKKKKKSAPKPEFFTSGMTQLPPV